MRRRIKVSSRRTKVTEIKRMIKYNKSGIEVIYMKRTIKVGVRRSRQPE